MRYLCLIYRDEAALAATPTPDREKMTAEYAAFSESVRKSGHLLGGDALQPAGTSTVVRVRDGRTSTTDGPFIETKEQLGGYYLFQAKDLNEAIQLSARIPGARSGSIEVRPIREM